MVGLADAGADQLDHGEVRGGLPAGGVKVTLTTTLTRFPRFSFFSEAALGAIWSFTVPATETGCEALIRPTR
jgi:hypothetical protein